MSLNLRTSKKSKKTNKLIRKINYQDNVNYDDIIYYGDNSYDDGYDEIILNDDIFIYDENLNDDFYKDDTLFY